MKIQLDNMMFTGGRKRSTGIRTSQKRYGYPHAEKPVRNSFNEGIRKTRLPMSIIYVKDLKSMCRTDSKRTILCLLHSAIIAVRFSTDYFVKA
ncbi:hypothetical protein PGB90_002481 [Kerria lacca]